MMTKIIIGYKKKDKHMFLYCIEISTTFEDYDTLIVQSDTEYSKEEFLDIVYDLSTQTIEDGYINIELFINLLKDNGFTPYKFQVTVYV